MNQPGLAHYSEFQEILGKYHMSPHAQQVLAETKIVLLIGPTSGGRNTIMRELAKTDRYFYIISDTTRLPRTNDGVLEQNGKEYWFRSEQEIITDLQKGEYLEAELLHGQQVSGISIRELEKAQQAGRIAITDVDLEGVHHVMAAKPDAIAIMLVPPSFEEWQRRLAGRGQMPPHEQKRRLQTAQRIFEDSSRQHYYHFVITDDVTQSARIIDAIVEGKSNPHQGRAAGLIQQIQGSLSEKLQNLDRI